MPKPRGNTDGTTSAARSQTCSRSATRPARGETCRRRRPTSILRSSCRATRACSPSSSPASATLCVVTMSGEGFVEFRDSNVRHFRVAPGDFVYVPAGTPHRIRAEGPMVQLRFEALHAGSEAVSWHCPECSTELWHRDFDSASEIAQPRVPRGDDRVQQQREPPSLRKVQRDAPAGRRRGHEVG